MFGCALANNVNFPLAANNLAVSTNGFCGCSNFQDKLLSLFEKKSTLRFLAEVLLIRLLHYEKVFPKFPKQGYSHYEHYAHRGVRVSHFVVYK
jgi:hypothetical protein